MGYRELLDALGAEVKRQAQEVLATGEAEAARVREEAARDARAACDAALLEAHREAEAERDVLLEPLRHEAEAARLRARREALDRLRSAADAALPSVDSVRVLDRLLDEVLDGLAGRAEIRVNPRLAGAARERLAAHGMEDLASVDGDPSIAGAGVIAICSGGQRRLDDTLSARLRVAWAILEGEIAARLFAETAHAHEDAHAEVSP